MQRKPTVINADITNNSAIILLKIDRTLEDFKGHFPSFPLLPGVTQIDLAMHYAREHLGITGEFLGMDAIKFQQPILPDMIVTLTLIWHPDKQTLHFTFQSDHTPHSSGRITLHGVS